MEISSAGIMTAAVIAFMALSIGGTQAAPVPIAGVIVGGPGEKTKVLSDLNERLVTPQNPSLFGFGRVTQINNLAGNAFCASGNCELTYVFRDYVPIAFNVSGVENSVVFTGGSVDFYLDTTPDASFVAGTGFDDGSPWLSLIGSPSTRTSGPNAGITGTLFSVVTNALDPQKINGSGDGLLQVTGGDAAAFFGLGNIMSFISAIQPAPAGYALPLGGPAPLEIVARNAPIAVPEPGALAMLFVGLIGLMRLSRATKIKPPVISSGKPIE